MADTLKVIPEPTEVNSGVTATQKIADALAVCVADTYRLVFKTHAYHWNVEGPHFFSIHKLTESQYEALFAAVDVIAERIRQLGKLTPMAFRELSELSSIKDLGKTPSAHDMIQDLVNDHESTAKRIHKAIKLAEDNKDPVTADMLTARSAFHEKAAWMLRAIIA